jgi:hypothetical protein
MSTIAPQQQTMSDGNLSKVLEPHQQVYIKETINILESASCGCCNETNKYWGFANQADSKIDYASRADIKKSEEKNEPLTKPRREEKALFYAEEHSGCFERLCCCNNHGFTLHFFDPKTGANLGVLERPGCFSGKFCLPCCSCQSCCIEEMHMYQPGAVGEVGNVQGTRIYTSSQSNCCSKPCGVNMQVQGSGEGKASMTVEAPCFFGGCKSLCIGDEFPITDAQGKVGNLVKPPPDSIGAVFKEICTDADEYSVQFAANASGDQKLAMTTAAFQADFMLFSHDKGPLYCEDCYNCDIACTICNCYICGLFRPFTCSTRYYRQNCWALPSKVCVCLQCLPSCGQGTPSNLG